MKFSSPQKSPKAEATNSLRDKASRPETQRHPNLGTGTILPEQLDWINTLFGATLTVILGRRS